MDITHRVFSTLCATAAIFTSSGEVRADLNAWTIRTVEWLVDSSDTIAIYTTTDDEIALSQVVRVLKGDAGGIELPLKESPSTSGQLWQPRSGGPARLVYVRGKSELLQEVRLARPRWGPDAVRLDYAVYGVSEFGELYLTEERLLAAISDRVAKSQARPADFRETRPKVPVDLSGMSSFSHLSDFPLESTQDTYQLVVPLNAERREHYIALLTDGDAAARCMAIQELYRIHDDVSIAAIREALDCKEAAPAFSPGRWPNHGLHLLTDKDVREAARRMLNRIDEKVGDGYPSSDPLPLSP
ncbi:hypothetical protein Pla175_34230 [Pirellulimonas nuda]|uniref:Uncharacterized protein n=1 Tax=Pirellulimonas nuda TaxID=2528009 RepID=A0A518DC73_9BACT|nr:hypothetical protein [Pirellulimonas nuda]QDU89084.1 hypothetical protein Pla175_24700 [Pirellulimonas nuda]QDU90024.1 hypothetical protein Pla175_34230 [Pirellulimonas nuda]